MLGCELQDIFRILTNTKGIKNPFLCENNTSPVMVGLMEQVWDFLWKFTLKPGSDATRDEDSIISDINMTYSKMTSVFATSAQAEFSCL